MISRPVVPADASGARHPTRPEPSPPGGRTVTHKVLSLLTTFEDPRRSFTLTQMADSAEVPLSTAHRLTNELVDWGFLTRTAQGKYQLGLRIWEMGQNVGQQLRETARPFTQDLYSLTGEITQLAIRDGREILFIDPGVLSRQLDAVAEDGYAVTVEEQRLGTCSIAVPVFHTGRIGAALGLVVASDKASTLTRHLPALQGISNRLEQAIVHIPLETLLESQFEAHDRS